MSCPDPEKISAFLDGELPSEEVSSLRSHLDTCRPCSDTARQLKGAVSLFQENYEELKPTGDLGDALRREIQPAKTRWAFPSLMRAPAFAALAFAVGLGAFLLFGRTPGPTPVYASGKIMCSVKGIKGICCIKPIEYGLRRIAGVLQVRVNAKNSEVELTTEKGKAVEVAEIAQALKDCGNFSLARVVVHPDSQSP